jgi:hypothetical protein
VIEDVRTPGQLRAAALLVSAESAALVVAAGVLLVKIVIGHPDSLARAFLEAAMALLAAAMLGVGARGLLYRRPSARTPVIVVQLLALPVAYSLAFQAGLVAYGGPILVVALAVLYLLFTPPVREVLDHHVD